MNLYALGVERGELLWAMPLADKPSSSRAIYASPAVVDGMVYAARKGFWLYGLDAKNGEKRWEFLFVVAPLRVDRATGSPVNPIAVF